MPESAWKDTHDNPIWEDGEVHPSVWGESPSGERFLGTQSDTPSIRSDKMQPADTGEPADIPDDKFNRKDTMGRTLKYDDMGKRVVGEGKTFGRPPNFDKTIPIPRQKWLGDLWPKYVKEWKQEDDFGKDAVEQFVLTGKMPIRKPGQTKRPDPVVCSPAEAIPEGESAVSVYDALKKATEIGDKLLVKILRADAKPPCRATIDAAGADIFACKGALIPPGGKAIVQTGIAIAIPYGTYARIAPRSGLASKMHIGVGAGVVDYDYRGEVGVVLFNHSVSEYQVNPGDRIAQLILEKIENVPIEVINELPQTSRGVNRFGSRGGGNVSGFTASCDGRQHLLRKRKMDIGRARTTR